MLDVDPALITAAARSLQADSTVIEGLRYQFSTLDSARANIGGDFDGIEQVIAELERQLSGAAKSR